MNGEQDGGGESDRDCQDNGFHAGGDTVEQFPASGYKTGGEAQQDQPPDDFVIPELERMVRYVQMNVDGWNLCRLELAQGAPPEEIPLGENQVYLYLGAAYEDIPLGTTIDAGWGRTGVVAGIFKKGQQWLTDNELRFFDENNSDSCIDMDYRLMMVVPRGVVGQVPSITWYFGARSGEDTRVVSDKIRAYLEQNNAVISMGSLKASFDAREALHGSSMKLIEQMMLLTLFSVVLIQVCVQMSEILTNQRRYGIFCANGMSVGALAGTVVIKNLLNLLLGGVIALVLGLYWVERKDILLEMALAKTAAVGLLAFAAAHVLPLAVMARTKPVRLMRGI